DRNVTGVQTCALPISYRITARLGAGASGVVYRARHTLLDQDFAVKVLAPELAKDADVRRRLLLEARSLTLFAHRHAVQVRHCGRSEERRVGNDGRGRG